MNAVTGHPSRQWAVARDEPALLLRFEARRIGAGERPRLNRKQKQRVSAAFCTPRTKTCPGGPRVRHRELAG